MVLAVTFSSRKPSQRYQQVNVRNRQQSNSRNETGAIPIKNLASLVRQRQKDITRFTERLPEGLRNLFDYTGHKILAVAKLPHVRQFGIINNLTNTCRVAVTTKEDDGSTELVPREDFNSTITHESIGHGLDNMPWCVVKTRENLSPRKLKFEQNRRFRSLINRLESQFENGNTFLTASPDLNVLANEERHLFLRDTSVTAYIDDVESESSPEELWANFAGFRFRQPQDFQELTSGEITPYPSHPIKFNYDESTINDLKTLYYFPKTLEALRRRFADVFKY